MTLCGTGDGRSLPSLLRYCSEAWFTAVGARPGRPASIARAPAPWARRGLSSSERIHQLHIDRTRRSAAGTPPRCPAPLPTSGSGFGQCLGHARVNL
jgi:hypothetical protein